MDIYIQQQDFRRLKHASNPSPAAQSGFSGPVTFNGAIQAPSGSTYIGVKFEAGTELDVAFCAQQCLENTAYDKAHPNSDGSYMPCNFFNAYLGYTNGQIDGTHCAEYTTTYGSPYDTNVGQYQNGAYYAVECSFGYSLTPQDCGSIECGSSSSSAPATSATSSMTVSSPIFSSTAPSSTKPASSTAGTPTSLTSSTPAPTTMSTMTKNRQSKTPVVLTSTTDVITTEIVYTTVTSCPVSTTTHHNGGSTSVETITSTSTFLTTDTVTTCGKCTVTTPIFSPPAPASTTTEQAWTAISTTASSTSQQAWSTSPAASQQTSSPPQNSVTQAAPVKPSTTMATMTKGQGSSW
ncbi:hypothetical protein HO133_008978 [Letharia lupina]|uniref:Uncharacterized protein n=1 Tax=Letharia lupina TaxID=560253 RepID=A0A8H6CM96_9LECA|nr:uncharacterized protein HO133_008978 [Letharia lupina]KAF6226112.1 hypothetical protein HO133_008978 [Letharia lupina]